MLNNALAYLIDVFFGLFTYALLLRFGMQFMRAPFRNPLGQAVMALTDWIVKPLRKVLPGYRGVDWASLVAAFVFQFAWLAALQLAFGRAFALLDVVGFGLLAALPWAAMGSGSVCPSPYFQTDPLPGHGVSCRSSGSGLARPPWR